MMSLVSFDCYDISQLHRFLSIVFTNLSQQMQVFQTLGVHWSVSAPSTRVPKTILQHLVYTKQLTHGVKSMKWNTIHDLEYTLLFLWWKDLLILFFRQVSTFWIIPQRYYVSKQECTYLCGWMICKYPLILHWFNSIEQPAITKITSYNKLKSFKCTFPAGYWRSSFIFLESFEVSAFWLRICWAPFKRFGCCVWSCQSTLFLLRWWEGWTYWILNLIMMSNDSSCSCSGKVV